MTSSDQPGNQPLTRKQLREMRLTGTTPVISEEDAAAAKAASVPAPPADTASAPEPEIDPETGEAPLTRRRVRQQEMIRTASVPVIESELVDDEDVSEEEVAETDEVAGVVEAEEASESVEVEEAPETAEVEEAPETAEVDEVAAPVEVEAPDAGETAIDWDAAEPVLAEETTTDAPVAEDESPVYENVPVENVPDDVVVEEAPADDNGESQSAESAESAATPVVNPDFGKDLLSEQSDVPAFTPSFDELITSDSGGSQSLAPNTLIFTPSAGERSLSGPVASTGEILVTGSYELPRGVGSQGHAHGTADGKEADAVLIDGELPPASSPTPIAASAAVSTIKPAGEVIRPPAPEKGNKLMLTLAITAGGLALVLAAALVYAFTMNVF